MKDDRRGIGMIIVWMFVFVAGALILILFFVIANIQAENAKRQLAYDAFQQVDAIIATQTGATESYATVPVPNEKMRFTCTPVDGGILSEISVGEDFVMPKSTPHQLLIGRDVETETLTLFSKQWLFPYHTGNMLYVTSPYELLIIQTDETTGFDPDENPKYLRFLNELPPPVQEQTTYKPPLPETRMKFQTTRYVVVSNKKSHHELGGDVQYIKVKPDDIEDPFAAGTVIYYQKDRDGHLEENPAKAFPYRGLPMLLAYIWAGDGQRAECITYKLAERIMFVTDIQRTRLSLLEENRYKMLEELRDAGALTSDFADVVEQDACLAKYLSKSALDELYDAAEGARNDRTFGDGVWTAVDDVMLRNEGMLRGVRCATIY